MLACAALLGAAGCGSLPTVSGLKVLARKGRPFVIVQTDKALGWGVANHPILCRVSDRRIAVSYWVAGDGAYSGTAPVPWPAYSDDDGKTWQFGDPYTWRGEKPPPELSALAKGEQFNNYNFGYFMGAARWASGERIAHARYAEKTIPRTIEVVRSPDGVQWEGPVKAPFNFPELFQYEPQYLVLEQKAVTMPDGRVLVVLCGGLDDPKGDATFLFESRDRGSSYNLLSVVATAADAPWGLEGVNEPVLALMPNGDLLVVTRTGAQWTGSGTAVAEPMLSARSTDGGLTWEHRKMSIRGVMPKLEVMSDGTVVLATGRPGNRLYFSTDNGRTWGAPVVLTPDSMRTSGYCDVMEVSPGRLLAIYDSMDTDLSGIWLWEPQEVNGILGVFVDVKKLF